MKKNQIVQFTQAWNTYIESCGCSPEEHGYKHITNYKGNFLYATNQSTGDAFIKHQKFIHTSLRVFSIFMLLLCLLTLPMLRLGYFPIFAIAVAIISLVLAIFCLFAKRYCQRLEMKFMGKICIIYHK
ncbi:MAG: hypothetical protein E7020_00590 [Alphaproteobacteria bacterium]|nr:hypothetical protein [Alphaproteobacteria bacterium]